jgi:hypothetical protein
MKNLKLNKSTANRVQSSNTALINTSMKLFEVIIRQAAKILGQSQDLCTVNNEYIK